MTFKEGDEYQIITKNPDTSEILSTVISRVIKVNNDRVHFIDTDIIQAWKKTKHQVNPKHQIYFKDMTDDIYEFIKIEEDKK